MKMKEIKIKRILQCSFIITLNELGKKDKMRGLPSILSLFHKDLNKFKDTRTQMLNSKDHMILKVHIFSIQSSRFYHFARKAVYLIFVMTVHNISDASAT